MKRYSSVLFLAASVAFAHDAPQDVFVRETGGYHTYRIPALLVANDGTLLAFCEGRKTGVRDSGDIDLVLKRSKDGGKTWLPQQIVWDDGENTCGNPAPVLDRKTGKIWLLMTHNLGKDTETLIKQKKSAGPRSVWVTHSPDNGATWAKPAEITAQVKDQEKWTWYATGPGSGIQLRDGRLMVACDHIEAGTMHGYSHVVFSEDAGATWKLGGRAGPGTNESKVVELADGSLVLNMRNHFPSKEKQRAIATSTDGGMTWSKVSHDATLIEPVCQGSLVRAVYDNKPPIYFFSNPASAKRERMTVRVSEDGCKTWPREKVLFPGPSAYSDLAQLPFGEIVCLFECGEKSAYDRIAILRFNGEAIGK